MIPWSLCPCPLLRSHRLLSPLITGMPFKVRPAAMPAQNGGHVPAETLPLRPAATSTQNGGYVTQSGRYVIQNGGHVPDENLQLRPAAMSTQNGGNVPAEGLPLQPAAIPTQPGGPIPAQGFPGRYYHPSYQIVKERLHAYSVNAMQGRLFLAPICDPSRILNVGCGMGITTSHLGSLVSHYQSSRPYLYCDMYCDESFVLPNLSRNGNPP